jgi:hypothetical protein
MQSLSNMIFWDYHCKCCWPLAEKPEVMHDYLQSCATIGSNRIRKSLVIFSFLGLPSLFSLCTSDILQCNASPMKMYLKFLFKQVKLRGELEQMLVNCQE